MRVGLVGMGNMGRHHYRNLRALGAQVMVCDSREGVKTALDAQSHYYADLDAMLETEKLDALDICTPTSSHHALAMKGLERGLDVMVEKPVATSLSQAKEMKEMAEKKGRCLFVGHIERFNPTVNALKKELEGQDLLTLQFTRVGPMPPQIKDAGVVLDLGIHDVDLAAYLSGQKIVSVSCASSSGRGQDDAAQMLLRLGGGATALITTNWLTPFKSRQIEAITRQKLYRADLISNTITAYFGFQLAPAPTFQTQSIAAPSIEPLRAELESFLRCVREKAAAPFGVDYAIAALAAVEAAHRSAREGVEVRL